MSAIELKTQPASIERLAAAIASASSVEDLTEARARVEALRGWAKVHGQAKAMRLDLLRVEVEALARIVQLGGLESLPKRDQKAAEYLASLSPEDRATLVAKSGAATSAAGMCRSMWTDEENTRLKAERRQFGRKLATAPPAPETSDYDGITEARKQTWGVRAALVDLVEDYTEAGVEFTVAEVADDLIRGAGIGAFAEDPDLLAGVKEVVAEAIRKAPYVRLENTVLPRTLTVRAEDGQYLRVPIENALLVHLAETRELRREQLKQDQAALDELDALDTRLREIPGASDGSRIGDLIAQSLKKGAAS